MCELFAMSSREATNVSFSFEEFARRGAAGARNPDGWGVAYFDGPDVRLMRDPAPTDDSACARFLTEHAMESQLVLSHVRKATQGCRGLPNTQPFARELLGRMHVFAHNGDLNGVARALPLRSDCFRPIGDTDSEHACCVLFERIKAAWQRRGGMPSLEERLSVVSAFAAELRPLGPANFLYADGDAVFAHGHRRTQPGRPSPEPPGLHLLQRSCPQEPWPDEESGVEIDASGLQRVLLFASIPLTREPWSPLGEGEVVVARGGDVVASTAGRPCTQGAALGPQPLWES